MWGVFMKALGIAAIVWLCICGFVLLIFHIKSKRLFKSVVLNALLGFAAIAIINLTSKFTGVHIPLNWYTVCGGGIFGLPCVCTAVILQIIIK